MAYPSQVTIDLDAVASNVRSIKSAVGDSVSLMAVVKANAYGHSACDVACAAIRNGADVLAVANLPEAIELRRAGIDAPILTLSDVPAAAIMDAIKLRVGVTVYDCEQAQSYQSAAGESRDTLFRAPKIGYRHGPARRIAGKRRRAV